ncbi:MAG: TIM barrel protein [Clostridiales bacterium]|mgnify:CR=1 FL=1|jgi:sugar phosphate isomerase/epimerase|nr:TIM barrel protein [Clostridiales bacterium]
MGRYRYGLELYSVKNELEKDMPATLQRVKDMGYEAVEFFGAFRYPAKEVKQALDDAELVCCGWHTPWQYVLDDALNNTIEYFHVIENPYVIIPGLPREMTGSYEQWLQNAQLFNAVARKLSDHGLRLGYHNHAGELRPFEDRDECPFTVLFDNTDPSIIVQMDNGHVLNGRGIDMLTLLKRYPGRYTTVHLKPYSLQKGSENPHDGYLTMIGEDDVPWSQFMTMCRETGGTKWYIVEYESIELYPEFEGVEKCLQALKKMEAEGKF